MFLKLLLITISFLAIAFLIMSVKVMFHKSKNFPSSLIGKNKEMAKRGISCAKHEEIKCFKKLQDGESCCG